MSKLKINLVLMLFCIFTTNVFAMNAESDTYLFEVGPKGLNRMKYQHDLLAEDTNEHLAKAGSLEGKKVLDVGCGFGLMTVELAKRVGDKGHVYAIDISDDQLNEAKKRAAELGLKNVTFIKHDARSLSDLSVRDFDLIYMRFVLSHINNPKDVVSAAKNLLKEGGVIATQDVMVSTFWWPHNEEIFVKIREMAAAMAKKTGNDYEIGNRLLPLHEQVGFSKVEGYFRHPQISVAEAKKLYLLSLAEVADNAIAAGVLSSETVENSKSTMAAWPEDDPQTFHMAKSGYVVAWK